MCGIFGEIGETIRQYLKDNNQRVQHIADPDNEPLQLVAATLTSSDTYAFHPSSELTLRMQVAVREHIHRLAIGFNLYSAYGYPLIRADYNDKDFQQTLAPGIYELTFCIPPYTLATGEYKVVFDVADIDLKNFAGPNTALTFNVVTGEKPFGNAFNETNSLKCSVIRQPWMKDMQKIG